MVGDNEVPTRVLTLTSPGLEARAWIDADGQVLRLESPFGIVLRKVTREVALAASQESTAAPSDPGALLELTAVRPRGKRPYRGARHMVIRITGMPDLGAVYEINSPPLAPGLSQEEAPVAEDLLPDPLIQSEHPRIRNQAAAIVGDQAVPWQKAVLLHDWVYREVEKRPVLSLPSALEVLQTREGDCNEHTVLFAALARASGIPTRIAIGVVWSDELRRVLLPRVARGLHRSVGTHGPHSGPDSCRRHPHQAPHREHRPLDRARCDILGQLEIEVLEVEGP